MSRQLRFQEHHYIHNETTGEITFVTDHHYYKLEKNIFKSNGVNIDAIHTIHEYAEYRRLFCDQTMEILVEMHRNKKSNTLQEKMTKAMILDDYDSMHKYADMIKRKDRLNLQVVK